MMSMSMSRKAFHIEGGLSIFGGLLSPIFKVKYASEERRPKIRRGEAILIRDDQVIIYPESVDGVCTVNIKNGRMDCYIVGGKRKYWIRVLQEA